MFYATTALLGSRGLWRSKHQGLIAAFVEHLAQILNLEQGDEVEYDVDEPLP